MKVYLDTCSLQRPLDSRTQVRIALEAEAVLGILAMVEAGEIELVTSEVLQFEIDQNPNPIRQEHALEISAKAEYFVVLSDEVEERAIAYENIGIKPLDALHLASAEAGGADYFCTCDDRLLKKAKTIAKLATKAVSPVELVEEFEK